MNYETNLARSEKLIVTGRAVGPGTLRAAAETLRKLADQLEAIATENPAPMHSATLAWEYDPGPSFDVGSGVATWTLTTVAGQ